MNGLLLLDKPGGMSSHDCVRRIRKIFHTKKVGHAGTLDPLATGVLPIAIGSGTKILQFLLAENKSYRAVLKLGISTDTLDAEGEVLSRRPVPENLSALLPPVLQKFRGDIEQVPPMYSALKKDGVPLYKLARQGIEVERKARPVTIHRLDLIHFQDDEVTIEVACSKGTYIRTLAQDIGEVLGCGAHLAELCRLSTGDFSLNECYSFAQLEDDEVRKNVLLPLHQALRGYPSAALDSFASQQLGFGIPPELKNVTLSGADIDEGALTRLMVGDELVAMAYFAPSRKKEKRGDFELIRVLAGTDK